MRMPTDYGDVEQPSVGRRVARAALAAQSNYYLFDHQSMPR
jgi:hypothetical protein